MNIELCVAYVSSWDNIHYPIYQLNETEFVCIEYSQCHNVYNLTIVNTELFYEYEKDYNCEYFNNIQTSDFSNF